MEIAGVKACFQMFVDDDDDDDEFGNGVLEKEYTVVLHLLFFKTKQRVTYFTCCLQYQPTYYVI